MPRPTTTSLFHHLTISPPHVSLSPTDEPWTLLVPKNEGLPRGGGFLTEKEATMDALLNHVILGEALLPPSATSSPSLTLGGTNLNFATDEGKQCTLLVLLWLSNNVMAVMRW
ncbi:hypothetical protein E2C01_100860 [Portunus trituberculatus]|uniref:FAS1 domain-containing protein n=1 Tax=Portunus trituberculatus TaxID=210409 RepID=A0A5B7K478_PORTR|nr:hypothetical protein [Portunus trituberculatus]